MLMYTHVYIYVFIYLFLSFLQLFDDVIDSSSGNFLPKTMAEKKKKREMEEYDEFNLTAIVCYYGRHYSTFVVDRRTNEDWIFIEDSQIIEVNRGSLIL